jgi:two-component system nitrate/nitrite response regulator NarL
MPGTCALKVLVVDDHVGVRAGIASLVDAEWPRMRTVGTASTAAEAMAGARQWQPDVVVLDVDLDGEDGLALIPALRAASPCAVVVLTSLTDPHIAMHAQRLGAFACLNKTAPAGLLLDSLALAGSSAFAPFDALGATGVPGSAGVEMSRSVGTKLP